MLSVPSEQALLAQLSEPAESLPQSTGGLSSDGVAEPRPKPRPPAEESGVASK